MRLLLTTDTVGGVWSFTSDLSRQLLGRGHAVHLISFGRLPSVDQQATVDALRLRFPQLFHFTGSEIPLEWMQDNEDSHSRGEALLTGLLDSSAPPDVILSNQFCFGRLRTTIPRVVVAHSDVLSWATACDPATLEPSPWLVRYTAMVQAGLLDSAALIAPTDWMGKALQTRFFLRSRYLVIPNGAEVQPATGAVQKRKLQAVSAGRLWDRAKGLDILAEVNIPMPVLIAGDLAIRPSESGASSPSEHTHLGALDRQALHATFRASSIYLCTSRYEPFGLAPLEAALCGCAVVARDLPSLREVWSDGALYFQDAASLNHLLRSLAEDPARLAGAQSSSLARASLFTPERMADSYLHLLHTVLQQQAVPYVA